MAMPEVVDLSLSPFPAVLALHHQRRSTGVLLVAAGPFKKRVYLQQGGVSFAASNHRNDRLGEMLVRRGVLSLPDFWAASCAIVPGKRFGTVLVERGLITPAQLVWAVKEQVKEIVFSLFDLPAGTCQLLSEGDARDETITLAIRTPELVRQGVARMDTITWPLEAFPDLDARFTLAGPANDLIEKFALKDEEQKLLVRLEREASLRELLGSTALSHFDLLKFLWALRILNMVLPAEAPPLREPAEPAPELEVTGEDLESLT
jgi:hypothetical protein